MERAPTGTRSSRGRGGRRGGEARGAAAGPSPPPSRGGSGGRLLAGMPRAGGSGEERTHVRWTRAHRERARAAVSGSGSGSAARDLRSQPDRRGDGGGRSVRLGEDEIELPDELADPERVAIAREELTRLGLTRPSLTRDQRLVIGAQLVGAEARRRVRDGGLDAREVPQGRPARTRSASGPARRGRRCPGFGRRVGWSDTELMNTTPPPIGSERASSSRPHARRCSGRPAEGQRSALGALPTPGADRLRPRTLMASR